MSPCYEAWARGVADDPASVALLDTLPAPKRQPNLVFSSARFCGAETGEYPVFAAWLAENWTRVKQTCLTHATQTNEAARCATLLPALALLPGPLALIEVGASAGLCLHPDGYSYQYAEPSGAVTKILHPVAGPSPVLLHCVASGPVPLPDELPEVIWRAGIDLNPLDVTRQQDVDWLTALIWPEHADRRERLLAAVDVARKEPVRIVRGDLNEQVTELVAQAPAGATVVVFHTAVLLYLDEDERGRFAETMAGLPARWLSNEAQGLVPGVLERLTEPPRSSSDFVLALDGIPLAFTQPHGRSIDWLA